MQEQYEIRQENLDDPAELRAVERLTYDAFASMERPKGDETVNEHLLAHKLRRAKGFVPQLDLVALKDGVVVGSIIYSEATVQQPGGRLTLLTFGPLSVPPAWQGKGVGGALIRQSLEKAAHMGYPGVVIFGHPGYYPRFGFVNAGKFGITTATGDNFEAFMACELSPGALAGAAGRLHLDPVYAELDDAELAVFNRELL